MSANHQIIHPTFFTCRNSCNQRKFQPLWELEGFELLWTYKETTLFSSDQLFLCCSFASSLRDRRHRDHQLHQPFIQLQLPLWGRSLCATPSARSPCTCIKKPDRRFSRKLHRVQINSLDSWILCLLKVKQYVVIFSWQFDTHVKESQNYTVREKILKGADDFRFLFQADVASIHYLIIIWYLSFSSGIEKLYT